MVHARIHETVQRLLGLIDDRLEGADSGDSERVSRLASVRASLGKAYDGLPDPATDRLTHLAHVFGLDAAEEQVLAAALAAEVDDGVAIAFDLLAGGQAHGHPTVGTVLELCGIATGSGAAVALFDEAGPLRRHDLVVLAGVGTQLRRRVSAPPRVAAHLLGSDEPDPVVDAVTVETLAVAGEESELIARGLASDAPLVWVHGPRSAGGIGVAAAGFERLGLPVLVVDVAHPPVGTPLVDVLRSAQREAGLRGAGLVVTGLDDLAETEHGPVAVAAAVRLVEAGAVPVVVASGLRWRSGWSRQLPLQVEVAEASSGRRAELWMRASGQPKAELGALADARLSPEDVLLATRNARLVAATRQQVLTPELLLAAARAVEASRESASVLEPPARRQVGLDDLILAPATFAEIERVVRWGGVHRQLSRERRGVFGRGGKGTGLIALFAGSPGTGKTLAAQVVADSLGLELMQVSLSATVDKYIGETEKNLERIFASAEDRDVVLFFDEADALFGSRSEVREAKDRYANQEVAYLLQRIEQFSGITILATNYRGNLDSAFMRRIQLVVSFPDPDVRTRERLWRAHLAEAEPFDPADPVDVALLAEAGEFTGGDIRNVALGAVFEASSRGDLLGMRHVREAAVREFRKLGRREPASLSSS